MPKALVFPLIGFIYDNVESTQPIPALLKFDIDVGIRLEVPFSRLREQHYAQWFIGDDEPPPPYLVFADHQVAVHLLNCRSGGFTGTPTEGIGYIAADYGIEDRDRHPGVYDGVHSSRSQVTGLHELARWQASKISTETDAQGLVKEMTITTVTQEPIPLGSVRGFECNIVQHWSGGQQDRSSTAIHESTWVQSSSKEPRSISEHLEVHRVIRDLVAFLYWRPYDFSSHEVRHEDHPARVVSGRAIGPAWRALYTIRTLRSHRTSSEQQGVPASALPSMTLPALGDDRLKAWFDVHREWSRVINPVMGLLFAQPATVDVALMQTSVAMEAYGYLAALRRGDTRRAANSRPYNQRLSEAVEALPVELGDLIGDDVSVWVQKAADAYNGTKHANRPLPDGIESWLIANTLIFILRLLMLRLVGAKDEELVKSKDRMGWNSLKDAYQRREK